MTHRIRDLLLALQRWLTLSKKRHETVAKDIDADGLADEPLKDGANAGRELRLCHRRSVLTAKEPAAGIQFEPVSKDLLKGL